MNGGAGDLMFGKNGSAILAAVRPPEKHFKSWIISGLEVDEDSKYLH